MLLSNAECDAVCLWCVLACCDGGMHAWVAAGAFDVPGLLVLHQAYLMHLRLRQAYLMHLPQQPWHIKAPPMPWHMC